MKKLILALAIAASFSVSAEVTFYTGNELLSKIQSDNDINQMVALGFVIGVHDSMAGVGICSPYGITARQAVDIVKGYLLANPQLRHIRAGDLTMAALAQVFPCAPKAKGTAL